MQELDFLLLLLADILLLATIIGFVLFILSRRNKSENTPTSNMSQDSVSDETYRVIEWIKEEQKKAQDSIEQGEFKEASELLKSLLAKLAPMGPKNHPQLRSDIEYALDDASARAILEDLKGKVISIDEINLDDLNVWNPEETQIRLDSLSDEGSALADEAKILGKRTSSELILKEVKLLQDELRLKVEGAKARIKKRVDA